MGVGTAFEGVGMMLSLLSQQQDADAREAEAFYNARLASRGAADAEARGRAEAGQVRTGATRLISEQKVGFATSGVDATVGTPAQAMADTRLMSEMDALTIENNAAREAWGFKMEESQIHRQRRADRQAAQMKMAGTVLGGSGRMFGSSAAYSDRKDARTRGYYDGQDPKKKGGG